MVNLRTSDFCHVGGEILMSGSIREAYEHGKGPITLRGKAFIEGGEESEDDSSEASTSTATKKSASRKKVSYLQASPDVIYRLQSKPANHLYGRQWELASRLLKSMYYC